MNNVSLVLTAILLIAMALMMAPNVIALNRGKMLRSAALWLAIFAALGLIYKNFGPGRSQAPVVESKPATEQNFTPPTD